MMHLQTLITQSLVIGFGKFAGTVIKDGTLVFRGATKKIISLHASIYFMSNTHRQIGRFVSNHHQLTEVHEASIVPPDTLVKYLPALHTIQLAAPLPEKEPLEHTQI